MPINPNRNKGQLDSAQVFRQIFDSEHDALRVLPACQTETAIEISAEAGDSVESLARAKVVKESDGPVDCSRMRKVALYGDCKAFISPDGTTWAQLVISIDSGSAVDICAMAIKVAGSGMAVMRS